MDKNIEDNSNELKEKDVQEKNERNEKTDVKKGTEKNIKRHNVAKKQKKDKKSKKENKALKSVLATILIVMLLVILVLVYDLCRKVLILNDYNKHNNEIAKITNFSLVKNEPDGGISEYYRKGNQAALIKKCKDGERNIYFTEDYDYIEINTVDANNVPNKVVVKLNRKGENATAGIPMIRLENESIMFENLGQVLYFAANTKINTEVVDGVEVYHMKFMEDWEMYFRKSDFLKLREINSGYDSGFVKITINNITDEDVKVPEFNGYTIKERKNGKVDLVKN